jgi:chitin disaccharide deacetylase
MGPLDLGYYDQLIAALSAQDVPLIDRFAMGLAMRQHSCEQAYHRIVEQAEPGVTYLSLHCSTPGEVERLHPDDAAWRIAEYRLFQEPAFLDWVARQDVRLIGFRAIREAYHGALGDA